MKAAQLYADHKSSTTTFQHYVPPTREEIAEIDLPFQKLLLNPDNLYPNAKPPKLKSLTFGKS